MHYDPPVHLLLFSAFLLGSSATVAFPNLQRASLNHFAQSLWPSSRNNVEKRDTTTNGSSAIWLPKDDFSGKTFFDGFTFFPEPDPTHGTVNYLNQTAAQQKNLYYVQDDGVAIMKADDTNWLAPGVNRDSVRIQSKAVYTTGLFILDLNQAPWGCAVWPAFWTVGPNWPWNGEIDIIEGVHDNEHNQVAWHTGGNCTLQPQIDYTGSISSNHTDCNGLINDNSGCSITEWSRASYGPFFDSQGGGVFAMKWDEDSIGVWSFYRAAVPQDIVLNNPDPSNWGEPSAMLTSSQCNITSIFANHSIVFDITFCGDWAGNSYATSGCPGTCPDRLMDPSNFVNATWSINSLKVYQKQVINGHVTSGAQRQSVSILYSLTSWIVPLLMLCGALLAS